jgi:NADPH-dependent 2,4-dienoyl-CoA reductase/sulfur reductase-like enzyme
VTGELLLERLAEQLGRYDVQRSEGAPAGSLSRPRCAGTRRARTARGLDALYVGFGVRARSELARLLGARCDPAGYLEVDQHQRTRVVPGLYAAGDVAAIAASPINVSLNDERWP